MTESLLLAIPVGLMFAISVWGAAKVPADTRFRMRFGGLGYETTISKTTALFMWPVLGAIVGLGAILAGDAMPPAVVWLSFVGLLILLGAQYASVNKARNY